MKLTLATRLWLPTLALAIAATAMTDASSNAPTSFTRPARMFFVITTRATSGCRLCP